MARPVRIERVGCWYHVTARGIDRRPIYVEDRDRFHWLELLAEVVETYRLILHAYVMMDNHYHFLIELRETNLSRADAVAPNELRDVVLSETPARWTIVALQSGCWSIPLNGGEWNVAFKRTKNCDIRFEH